MSCVSLALWRRRFSGNHHAPPLAEPPWLPVVIGDDGPPTAGSGVVYVMIAGAFRLEVPTGFSPTDVQALWRIVHGGTVQHSTRQCP